MCRVDRGTSVGFLLRAHSGESRTPLVSHPSPLSSDVATSPPSFLPQRPVPARVVGASMDYDYSFDSPRSPVFVEGGGASPTGWPLHRMTLQPWRIYDPSFRYHHSVYEGLNAHVLARDDGRDQRPGRGPPARPAGCFALIMHEMAHLRFHDALSLFIPLLSRSGRLMDSQAASVRTLITPPSSLSPRR